MQLVPYCHQGAASCGSVQYLKCHVQDVSHIYSIGKLLTRLATSTPGSVFAFGCGQTQRPLPFTPEDSSSGAAVLGRDFSDLVHSHASARGNCKAHGRHSKHHEVGSQSGVALQQGGAIVCNACLQLGISGVIVLEGSSDTVFRNCVFQGARQLRKRSALLRISEMC